MGLKDKFGDSTFHAAVRANYLRPNYLEKLVIRTENLRPNSRRDRNGRLPIELALETKQDWMALYLIQLGVLPSGLRQGVLGTRSTEMALTIIEACNHDPSFWNSHKVADALGKLLEIAIRTGRTNAVGKLLMQGPHGSQMHLVSKT